MKKNELFVFGAGATAMALIAWIIYKYGPAIAASVKGAVNPLSKSNAAYSAVNAVGADWTGNPNWDAGTALHEFFRGDAERDMLRRNEAGYALAYYRNHGRWPVLTYVTASEMDQFLLVNQ